MRDLEANQQYQAYLKSCSKWQAKLGRPLQKRAIAWGGEDYTGFVASFLGARAERLLYKVRCADVISGHAALPPSWRHCACHCGTPW